MGQFGCPLCCGRMFSTRQSLKYHILTSESNITCPECARRFTSITELADHLDLDFCDQAQVLVTIPDEGVNNVKAARTVEVKKPVPRASDRHKRLGPLTQNTCQNVVPSPKKDNASAPTAENEEFIVCSDAIPTDAIDFEVVVTDAVDGEYDIERTQGFRGEDAGEGDEHYCNSCNCKVDRVMEHVNKFHPNEMVIFQNAEVISVSPDRECVDLADHNDDNEPSSLSDTEDGIRNVPVKAASPEQKTKNLQKSTNTNVEKVQKQVATTPVSANKNPSRPVDRRRVHPPAPLFVQKPPEKSNSKVTRNTKGKTKYPKMYGTVDESFKVDPKTGIPYVRRVVHIEKFWETDAYKKKVVVDTPESVAGENDDKGQADTEETSVASSSIKNNEKVNKEDPKNSGNIKKNIVPPKLKKSTLIQAHISQLVRSGVLNTLKESMGNSEETPTSNEDILKKLFTAANEHHELESCGSADNKIRIKTEPPEKDERESIFKVVSDLNGKAFPVLICSNCKAEFSTAKRFTDHRCKIRKSTLPTVCELCGLKCRSNRCLRSHLESHDPNIKVKKLFQKQVQKLLSKPVTCKQCNTEFTTEGGLKIHQRMHRPNNVQKVAEMNNKVEYRCDLCNMVCYSTRTFRIHCQVHTGSQLVEAEEEVSSSGAAAEAGPLACRLCSESFVTNEELKTHWKSHYLSGSTVGERDKAVGERDATVANEEPTLATEEYFACKQCGKCIALSHQEMHEKMHNGETKFDCNICNKPFATEENLALHMITHKSDSEFKCIHCQAKFIDSSVLKAHVRTHKSLDRPYPCGFCGRRFSRPHEKVKHERIHTGEKPYECPICGMRFRVGYCLRMHERIHTGVRPYTCEHCGKTFRARSGYKQHIRLHSDVRAFSCPFCPKTFKTVVQLAGHKKSHTKPFTCPDCGRRFATMYMVRSHMNSHSQRIDSLKYRCYICGASYGRDYALKDHIKTHGKDVPPPPPEKQDYLDHIMGDFSDDSNNT